MEHLQFNFDKSGVQDWKNYLYSQTRIVIEEETIHIETNFMGWVSKRFYLNEKQLQYAISLGKPAHDYFASQLVEAIDLRIDIQLDREDEKEGGGNSKTGSAAQSFTPVSAASDESVRVLKIRFNYS